ncbi:hypothetical protein GCM10010342_76790 [Streptomyces anulatus]|nr:hypothetical protein GCM10010342_76790 [Streptomyces anulatus]
MAMKDYSDEFKADAVALFESTPGATYKSIAADLGINRNTLRNWVLQDRERRAGRRAGCPDRPRDSVVRSGRAGPATGSTGRRARGQ